MPNDTVVLSQDDLELNYLSFSQYNLSKACMSYTQIKEARFNLISSVKLCQTTILACREFKQSLTDEIKYVTELPKSFYLYSYKKH